MRVRDLSLGAKLSLSLLAFLLLLAAATSAAVLYGFHRTQSNARGTSQGGLEDFGSSVLGSFSRLVAASTSLEFARASEAATSGATYMATFKGHGVPAWDASRLVEGHDGIRYDPAPDRVADAWVPNFLVNDPDVDARLRDASALDPLFGALLQNVPDGVAAYFIGTGGEGRYYPPNGVQDVVPPDFDLWSVPGFDAVRPDKNPERKAVWTSPYEDSAGQGLIVSAIAPVYFRDEFIGVVGIDISLDGFIAQIDAINPSEHGFAFYIDRGGILLATARSADVAAALHAPDHASLLAALDAMRGGEAGTARTKIGSDDVVVGYAPVDGLGGSLGLVAPVEDIRDEAGAAAVTDSIGHEGNVTLRITLATVAAMYVLALAVATWLNRRVLLRPIGGLVDATRSVASGDLSTEVPVSRGDELGELGQSFNVMVRQLRESERVLEQRVDDRTRELSGLLEVTRVVSSTLQLRPLLQLVLEQTASVLPYDRSAIMLREGEDLQILAVRAGAGDADETLARQVGMLLPLSRTPVLWNALRAGDPVFMADVQSGDQLAVAYREEVGTFIGLAVSQFRSWMGIPLIMKGDVAGIMTVARAEAGAYESTHAALGKAIASQVAIAIENAQLFEQAQRAASLEERGRLARELHDSVSQALYGITLGAGTARARLTENPDAAVEPIEYVQALAQAGLAEMRALIFELRPESLETEGLLAAIEKQGASISARHNVAFELNATDEPDCSLAAKEALYRIAQEAMHNVVKHAGASSVRTRLERTNGALVLSVRDDGRGFDPASSFPGHVGLHSMRERAEKLGGTLTIESELGRGTTVVARLPV
jgi:signal transduction histidine kinase